MAGFMLLSGSLLTGCDNDDLDTNQYNKKGVNLLGFGPCPLKRLDNMRITGTQLNKVDKVLFPQGNTMVAETNTYEEAQFTLINNEEIEVIVPDMVVPGKLRLVVGNDTIVSVAKITFEEEVVVKNVTPTKGLVAGDVITITGDYVWNIATVTFNSHVVVEAENFLKNTRGELQVAVPLAAQSGEITFGNGAEKPVETAWEEPLEILNAEVTGISKDDLEFGETLTITGKYLNLVEKVNFPLVTDDVPFTVNSAGTELTTTVPANAVSGKMSLVLYSGLIVEASEIALPMATFVSVSPKEDLVEGDVVEIVGTNLNRIILVKLPGDIKLNPGEFTQSESAISFTVPKEMGDGKVVLVQHENYSVETEKITRKQEGEELVIWTGSWACGSWGGNQDLAWGNYDWSKVKLGQDLILYVDFADPTAGWACISPRFGSDWANWPSIGQIDLTPSVETQRVVIKPTAADLEGLQTKNGLVLTGQDYILNKVALTILEEVIWTGNWTCSSWGGNQDLAWGEYDWSTFTLGQKLILTVGFADPTAGWACISPRTGSSWGSWASISQIDLTPSAEDQKVVITPTAADIELLQTENGLVLTGDGGYILKKISIR